ncbi:cell division protein FtsL [Anaerobacillus arseniciselenatis]|uniref:Cell division protein FtsL n=1 Tax=Anaerobacillus arseniciselenatis TaxID=85682 RepID=A0A1S2LBD8_9BACI|nr:cell division protein FtsL [Anaerobacillus arseniciselenatis]OIJ09802.1 cell division protein FtsL [Anaerobacillus arseniciselenatis]
MSNLARQLERKRIADHTQEQRTKTVRESSGRRRITIGERLLYFATILGLVFATYFIISTYASIYIVNKEIHTLERTIATQTTENEALNLQVTELSAPDRILKIAKDELGMELNDNNVKVVQN